MSSRENLKLIKETLAKCANIKHGRPHEYEHNHFLLVETIAAYIVSVEDEVEREEEEKEEENRFYCTTLTDYLTREQVEGIAEYCHESNKLFCEMAGDYSQLPWENCPLWRAESAIAGVAFALLYPENEPIDSHENWMLQKKADGWKYGAVKDVEKKEHPCLIPYEKLSPHQQAKDKLFLDNIKLCLNCSAGGTFES